MSIETRPAASLPLTATTPASPAPDYVRGTLCGLFAAVGYTIANSCLRAVVGCNPVWVSAVKAFPTVALVAPWMIVQYARGDRLLPSAKVLGVIALAGLLGQIVGNVLFQWSLGVVGIALSVPLTLGTIIVGGALLGRMFLGEPITARMFSSMAALIVAITVLSLGAGDAHRAVMGVLPNRETAAWDWYVLVAGVGAATLAGVAYAVLGVVIRYGVTGRASLTVTLVTIAMTGVVSLGGLSHWQIGWEGMWDTSSADLGMMLLAGIWNAVSFIALTRALQLTNVVFVNALNSTQAALAAVAGVLFFHESLSQQLAAGVLLTVVGLWLMRKR